MSATNHYATDLSDEQWAILEPLLPEQKWHPGGPGRPPCDVRQGIYAIFYVNKTGCQWRMLPKDFGHWNTVYGYFWRWRHEGLWSRMMEQLRHAERRRQGRRRSPRQALLIVKALRRPRRIRTSVLTETNESKGANAICWLIPWV